MKIRGRQRGVALIMALVIMALFLAVGILLLTMTTQNSQNFGNAYQKQKYYDVAEAGIDRGLRDLDTTIPLPGSAGFLTATPGPPPPTPSGDQTPLPNTPNVTYYYSYWYNPSSLATTIPDPLAGSGFTSNHNVNVPSNGAVIWSRTTVGIRDVAVEVVVDRFGSNTNNCALCAGGSIGVTGSNNFNPTAPPTVCGSQGNPFKICSDPHPVAPAVAPTNVPIVAGGLYTCSGGEPTPCAYGGTTTPNPIQTTASTGVTSGFLASQGTIDQLSNAAGWLAASTTTTNIKYIDCTSSCNAAALQAVAPAAGQVTFVNGNMDLSSGTVSYGGLFIISGCLSISGHAGITGGTSTSAGTTVLGTDSQCGGNAINISGGGNSTSAPYDGGTAYAAQGSASISGNGSVKGYNFYGALIAANNVTVGGNGFFAWESALVTPVVNFGPFGIVSFAQY